MPINYIEKGLGLHERIAAAGHWLQCVDGVWQASDLDAVQAIIDGYTLADTKREVSARITAIGRALRDAAVAGISPAEMASWTIKRAEAQAIAGGATAEAAPLLSAEALARGCTLAELVARVQANATALAGLEAAIAGTEGRHRDAVTACEDFASVLAYDFSAGWPA